MITISIGVACAEKPGVTFEQLYQHADKALYTSKETGKNKVTLREMD
ncbi:MAG: diguanylate cyclase [Paenibacillaceae bacterium]